MQGHLRGQTRLQPAERMWPFPIEAKGVMEFLIDRLHNLADAREPAPPWLGPRPLTVAPWRADDLGAVGRPPHCMVGLALKALVDDVRTLGGRPDTGHTRMGRAPQGKK